MEFQKIVILFDMTPDNKDLPRYATKKWIEVYDQTGRKNHNFHKEIRIKTPMVRSDLCDFSDAYIVVKERVTSSFNPKRADYVNNDALYPDDIFPDGSTADQIKAARNAARTNTVNTGNNTGDRRNLIKGISFENNAQLFINCILKINGAQIENAENLDVVLLIHNLLEHSKNYRKATGRL